MPWFEIAITLPLGVWTAVGYGKYMTAYHDGKALVATMWDISIMLCSSLGTLQLWAASGDHPLVLTAYILGNAAGTYYVTKHTHES